MIDIADGDEDEKDCCIDLFAAQIVFWLNRCPDLHSSSIQCVRRLNAAMSVRGQFSQENREAITPV